MPQLKIKNSKLKIAPFSVVILAAGASSRMGRPKLLLPWRDTTVIGHIIRQWRELGADQIAIVHRPNDQALVEASTREELKRRTTGTLQGFNTSTHFLVNPQPERGMFSSIQCAANWDGWKSKIAVWAIVLGDQPHLRSETLRALLEFQRHHQDAICQPEFSGHGRHPVLLPKSVFVELKQTRAGTLKEFLEGTLCPLAKYPIEDSGLSLDMDTPADYKRLHDSLNP